MQQPCFSFSGPPPPPPMYHRRTATVFLFSDCSEKKTYQREVVWLPFPAILILFRLILSCLKRFCPMCSWFKHSWFNAHSHHNSLTSTQQTGLSSSRGQQIGSDFFLIWLLLDAGMVSNTHFHFLSLSFPTSLLLSPPHLLAPNRCALAALYICSNNNIISIIKPRMS